MCMHIRKCCFHLQAPDMSTVNNHNHTNYRNEMQPLVFHPASKDLSMLMQQEDNNYKMNAKGKYQTQLQDRTLVWDQIRYQGSPTLRYQVNHCWSCLLWQQFLCPRNFSPRRLWLDAGILLTFPDPTEQFGVKTDTSNSGITGVLCMDKKLHPSER